MPRGKRRVQKPVVITIDSDDENKVLEIVDDPEDIDLAQERAQHRTLLARQYQRSLQENRKPYAKAEIVKVRNNRYRLKSAVAQHFRTTAQASLKESVLLCEGIAAEHVNALLNNDWVSDAIVWPFFQAVASKNEISVLDSTYSGMENFADLLRDNPNYANLDRAAFRASSRILWPMFADSHWYLVIMHRVKEGEYQLYCIDSLNKNNKAFLDKAASFLQVMYPDKAEKELIKSRQNIEILEQHNQLDCAAAVCFWGMRMAASVFSLPGRQSGTCDYSAFRYDIAEQIAEFAAKKINEAANQEEAPKRKAARYR